MNTLVLFSRFLDESLDSLSVRDGLKPFVKEGMYVDDNGKTLPVGYDFKNGILFYDIRFHELLGVHNNHKFLKSEADFFAEKWKKWLKSKGKI